MVNKKQPSGLIITKYILSCPSTRYACSRSGPEPFRAEWRDIRLLQVVEVRGKAEDADHERSRVRRDESNGAPSRIRTYDRLLKRQLLYQAEL